MNKKIDELTKIGWEYDASVFNSTEALRKTLINLKIIATETNKKDEISAFADFLSDNIKKIQESTFKLKEIMKEIAVENKKGELKDEKR